MECGSYQHSDLLIFLPAHMTFATTIVEQIQGSRSIKRYRLLLARSSCAGNIEISRAARKFRKTPREERGRKRPPLSPPPTEPHTKLLSLAMDDRSVPLVGRGAAAILLISRISLALASAVATGQGTQLLLLQWCHFSLHHW